MPFVFEFGLLKKHEMGGWTTGGDGDISNDAFSFTFKVRPVIKNEYLYLVFSGMKRATGTGGFWTRAKSRALPSLYCTTSITLLSVLTSNPGIYINGGMEDKNLCLKTGFKVFPKFKV